MKVLPIGDDSLFKTISLDLINLASGDDEIIANYFVVRADNSGMKFCHALFQAACRGVRVSLIVDSYGSMMPSSGGTEYQSKPLSLEIMNTLSLVGVKIYIYHPINSPKIFNLENMRNWNNFSRRNHNKNLVFNIKSKSLRGLIIGDSQWADEHFNGQMLGSNIYIECPDVYVKSYSYQQRLIRSEHVEIFEKAKSFSTADSVFQLPRYQENMILRPNVMSWHNPEDLISCQELDFFASEIEFKQASKRHTIQDYEIELMGSAKNSIRYCTPYFSPDHELQHAFIKASKKLGDRLNILLGKFRHDPYLPYGVRRVAKKLLKYQVNMFEYNGRGNIHYKDMVVDDYSFIKTANGEGRSRFYNLETGVIIKNEKLAQKLKDRIWLDFENSKSLCLNTNYLNQHPWWQRPTKLLLCPVYFHHL